MTDVQALRGIWTILLSMSVSAFLFNAQPALPDAAMQSGGLVIVVLFAWGQIELVSSNIILSGVETVLERVSEAR